MGDLEQYAAAARDRALTAHPQSGKSPRCFKCDDTGWEPLGTNRLAPVRRCANGCDIPQADHLKRRTSHVEQRDDF